MSVSRDVKDCVRDVNAEELKNISRVLGIFLDNAIVLQKGNRKNIIKYNMERKIVIDVIQRKFYCISWGIY